ncbi:hypothetical protein [Peptoniphilus asaccharolyticus]
MNKNLVKVTLALTIIGSLGMGNLVHAEEDDMPLWRLDMPSQQWDFPLKAPREKAIETVKIKIKYIDKDTKKEIKTEEINIEKGKTLTYEDIPQVKGYGMYSFEQFKAVKDDTCTVKLY